MAVSGFNVLWILCVFLLLVAFFLAIRRRRLANRHHGNRAMNTTANIHQARQAYNEVRIHMATRNNATVVYYSAQSTPTQPIQVPPPAFDPQDVIPPPSYQDFQKDVRIHSST